MPDMRPPHALSGGRLAALGAPRGSAAGCKALAFAAATVLSCAPAAAQDGAVELAAGYATDAELFASGGYYVSDELSYVAELTRSDAGGIVAYSLMGGVQFARRLPVVTPIARLLVGSGDLTGKDPDGGDDDLGMQFGGGLDVRLAPGVAIRSLVSYRPFFNDKLRVNAGVAVSF